MTQDHGATGSALISGTWRAVFYAVMIGLALLEVFVTFRGLRSAAGMEQAQLAREMARGHGWVTKCVRPAAWKQVLEARPGTGPDAVPDTSTPPLPVLLLAPLFKLAESAWEFQPAADGVVYALDRIVAAVGVTAMLLLLLNLHGLARSLFDEKVAVVTVVAAGLCDALWDLAVSGSPRILLALELVVTLRLALSLLKRLETGQPVSGRTLQLGVVLAAMAATHGFGLLWAALTLAWLALAAPRAASRLLLLAGGPLLLLLGLWLARNVSTSGDLLGASKLALRAIFSNTGYEITARSFNEINAPAGLQQILRMAMLHFTGHCREIHGLLGLMLAALFFPVALAHRFRRRECRLLLGLLTALLGFSLAAMSLLGPVTDLADEHNTLLVLAPLLAIFGAALAAMLWQRRYPAARTFQERWGYAVVLAGLTALPLLVTLPDTLRAGLVMRGQLAQWPPYAADRVALVGRLLDEDEVLLADAPWFTAWYTDRLSLWLPSKRADLPPMKAAVEAAGLRIAGAVVTPVSARTEYLGQIFDGKWSEWPDVVLRGPLLAFDRKMATWPDFPYPLAVPLVGFSTSHKEGLGLLMAFYTDRQRTPK